MAATLQDLDAVLSVVGEAIRSSVSEYSNVTESMLRNSTEHNVAALLQVVGERRALTAEEVAVFEATVEERARMGVALDQYLLAVTVAEEATWHELWRHAPEPVTAAQMLEGIEYRLAALKTITRTTATAHRRVEMRTAREEYERRAVSLRSLLRGGLTGETMREHSRHLGLELSRPYMVVRARARGGLDSDQVQRLLAGIRNHPPHAVFTLWGDDVVGLLTELPAPASQMTAGVAGPVLPESLARAHEAAHLAFSTAWALGLTGIYTQEALGLQAAVAQVPDMGSSLRHKYLAPLQASGGLGGELLATVRAYLDSGSRRDGAAARLHIHINTVGYRLARFCDITGADLTDFTTLAELWWLCADLDQRPLA